MRRAFLPVLAMMTLPMLGCGASSGAGGCAVSGISSITPTQARAGDEIRVTGSNFLVSCGDVTSNGVSAKTERFTGTKSLILTQGGTTVTVTEVQIKDGAFAISTQVPPGVRVGTASLQVTYPQSAAREFAIIA